MNHKLISLILGILALGACQQYNGGKVPVPTEGSIMVSNRLSNQRVNCIAEDAGGLIWMGTQRGLNCFDSHEFVQFYCTDDTLGLPDNQIYAIHPVASGHVWVTAVGGAAVSTDGGTFVRVPIEDANINLNQILETRSGKLLFSNGTNLLVYNEGQNVIRPAIRGLNAFGAQAVCLDGQDRLWAISAGGWAVNCYNAEDFSLVSTTRIPFQAYHICDALDGTIWLSGMGDLGILKADDATWLPLPSSIQAEKRLMDGDIDQLYALDSGNMLLGTIGHGFFLYQKTLDRVLFQADDDFPYEMPDAEVRTLFRDSRENLWIGTTDKGYSVSYHTKNLFSSNKPLVKDFENKTVTSLCPDQDGNLWISTLMDGLWRYNLESRSLERIPLDRFIQDNSLGYIRVSCIFCDSEGELWLIFTEKMQVTRCHWNGKQLVPIHSFFVYNPMSIEEDDQGYIWLGCYHQNLYRYDKKTREMKTVTLSDQWTYVSDLVMKEPGRLIVACFNSLPMEVNTYTFDIRDISITADEYKDAIRRSVLIPNKLFKDSTRDIWLGTITNGIIRYDQQTGRIQAVAGLPCQDVTSIEEDLQGNVWVSTMDGLAKFDRTNGRFRFYMEEDGTGGDQYSDRASCILPDGTLVFGGTHGLTWFHPLDAPAKRTVPLAFEYLSIHNQMVKPTEGGPIDRILASKPDITIRANHNAFSITFSALEYSDFEQIRYAYKLEGFDKDWVRINTQHSVYFSNLPAGKYKFRVRIANASQSITETEESLNIRVLPPWYRSGWAYLVWALMGLALLAVAYTFVRHVRRVRKEAARRIWQVRREREKAEEAEKAEKELNKIQQNYFANVAHEFRTPLTMIAGPAQQLSDSQEIQGQDKKLVDIIRRNTTWLLSLVNQLLDFNRIGNSKLEMKVAQIDIVQPLRDTADLFGFNAKSKGIDLITYGLEDPFQMWVDADKVQKMVMNLLSNALKFTPTGGKVSLSFDVLNRADAARRFPLTEADKDTQWACISVADNGPGIPEDQLEKIFERFYQSDAGKQAMGSGIGLYYARALCTLHHGFIKAWNRPEGGALFSMCMPVSESSYTEDERVSQAPLLQTHDLAQNIVEDNQEEEENKKHVVVIDDDIDIANYLKVMLKPHYKVSLYYDGESALKGMAEDAPDLIISDVVMPGLDGYEVCRRIKADLQLSHVPVVLVTAKVAVENQVEGLDQGADAYVTKPFQPAYLMALIKSLLENREKLHRQLASATSTEDIAPEALSPRDAAFMKELYELMEKELANADLDIVQITEMMKISRTKFYYKVKGLTGENPSVFFKRYKLNRAADLLKEGKHNMSEIAWMTGFNTLSHFSTSFKKQFGVPPSEYVG
ncbi:MAG: response regulator [Bacteroidales bacterium]|nr:response regulator [Bacteroidales bacterium]